MNYEQSEQSIQEKMKEDIIMSQRESELENGLMTLQKEKNSLGKSLEKETQKLIKAQNENIDIQNMNR